MAKKQVIIRNSAINGVERLAGETIEQKMLKVVHDGEKISEGAPKIYTERKNGVNPAHDIRTDRWEIAVDAMDAVAKSHQAKRDSQYKELTKENIVGNDENEVKKAE